MYFITGTADKESLEGCHGQIFCIVIVLFLSIYGVCFIVRKDPGVSGPFRLQRHARRSAVVTVKGALHRIWCGVNRLSDSGVKVV